MRNESTAQYCGVNLLDARVAPASRYPAPPRIRGTARLFIIILVFALVGYAYGNKGFAYIGIVPIYVDSLIFSTAVLVLIFRPRCVQMIKDPSIALLSIFMIWGAARTIPFIGTYGIEALRDSVVWAWGTVALVVAHLVGQGLSLNAVASWYGTTMKWFVVWISCTFPFYIFLGDILPRLPWGPDGGVPILLFKGGDVGVQLAGVMAFFLVIAPAMPGRSHLLPTWVTLPCWLISFVVAASINRGGFLALLFATAFAAYCARLKRVAVLGIVFGLFVLFGVFSSANDLLPEYRRGDRAISVEQLTTNIQSIFADVDNFGGTGTKHWRLEWWNSIIAYTFDGDYFWTGKGFGINLADDDGFQVTADNSLRSPHNGHLTILARMGVPGFTVWILFLLTLLVRLWKRYKKWKRLGEDFQASICAWVLTFLVAALINATFDVYLEGPMGGIWFWSVAGLAIGLLGHQPLSQRVSKARVCQTL
jgi:hypothetical protein